MLIRSLIIAGWAGLAGVLAAPPAAAAPVAANAGYVVTLSGINIANLSIDLNDDGARYSVDLSGSVSGLGQLVAQGTARVETGGISSGRQLVSEHFMLETRAAQEAFRVNVSYARGNVTAFVVDPPLVEGYDRVPIERSHLDGVGDAISSFILKGSLDKALCRQDLRIFTGVERFDATMSYVQDDVATSMRTGYQGPVVLCNVRYKPISGHFRNSEMTIFLAKSDRILIWYAPLGDTGYSIPYRVLMTTGMGDLSMVLTGLSY